MPTDTPNKSTIKTTFDDLPVAALRFITRSACTRYIPGTNRYARVCRRWRDAATGSEAQEQLQLLLALEGLYPDSVMSTSDWLERHGQCVTSLDITFNPATAPLFQQLPLSTAPLVGLARLEVDGPDSLVALAPALPQLVALTHLRASIGVVCIPGSPQGVFSAQGVPLPSVPSLQQLCPGLRSLQLVIVIDTEGQHKRRVDAPVADLLPVGLEQLTVRQDGIRGILGVSSTTLMSFTSLRSLSLLLVAALDPDLLLTMPGLQQLDLRYWYCGVDGNRCDVQQWLTSGLCTAPQHLAKLTGLSPKLVRLDATPSNPLHPAALSSLRKLEVNLLNAELQAWAQQQLSGFKRLDHLMLHLGGLAAERAPTVLSALSSAQHLTYLGLLVEPVREMRSTWAALLPHLPKLRVLTVSSCMLREGGLAPELTCLKQLQCLYVGSHACDWDPAARGAEVAAHLEVLSQCSSLRAVLCWSYDRGGLGAALPLWEHVHGGKVHLSAWHGWCHAAQEGRVVCPRPCPHLPGVWELQQQEPADGASSE